MSEPTEGCEPTKAEQERFYQLFGAYARIPYKGGWNPLRKELAFYRFNRFCRRHRGMSFKVFRPEDIERAFSTDATPLFGGVVDAQA